MFLYFNCFASSMTINMLHVSVSAIKILVWYQCCPECKLYRSNAVIDCYKSYLTTCRLSTTFYIETRVSMRIWTCMMVKQLDVEPAVDGKTILNCAKTKMSGVVASCYCVVLITRCHNSTQQSLSSWINIV